MLEEAEGGVVCGRVALFCRDRFSSLTSLEELLDRLIALGSPSYECSFVDASCNQQVCRSMAPFSVPLQDLKRVMFSSHTMTIDFVVQTYNQHSINLLSVLRDLAGIPGMCSGFVYSLPEHCTWFKNLLVISSMIIV
jgi:hypothetical protein